VPIIMRTEAVVGAYKDRIADLERQLSTARADALREAYAVCVNRTRQLHLLNEHVAAEEATGCAVAIRALIPPSPQEK
jgi:hypothetical protein